MYYVEVARSGGSLPTSVPADIIPPSCRGKHIKGGAAAVKPAVSAVVPPVVAAAPPPKPSLDLLMLDDPFGGPPPDLPACTFPLMQAGGGAQPLPEPPQLSELQQLSGAAQPSLPEPPGLDSDVVGSVTEPVCVVETAPTTAESTQGVTTTDESISRVITDVIKEAIIEATPATTGAGWPTESTNHDAGPTPAGNQLLSLPL